MKKIVSMVLSLMLFATLLTTFALAEGIDLTVVTSYGADDGNRPVYEEAYKAWEEATGNTVKDASAASNEEWKARILADFETGSEPDVLFFFSGVDANPIIESGKVISLEEIRKEYPNFAENMADEKMSPSPFDGKLYAVPTSGYWEGLYVNKALLEEVGVPVPNGETTWEEFLDSCQKIKDAGFTPIAVSLSQVPHYWFEFTILNNGTPSSHEVVPKEKDSDLYKAWVNGLEDIKELYQKGFLPVNTLTATDDETMQLMADGEAAFAIDGSWKMGWFKENTENLEDYTVTYVPAKGERKATDMIGGLSMGFYVTKKAWENPEKREAAVSFIEALTSTEVVGKFAGGTAATALKEGTPPPDEPNSLQLDALDMINSSTGTVAAVQDNVPSDVKDKLMTGDIKLVATQELTAEEAVDHVLELMK